MKKLLKLYILSLFVLMLASFVFAGDPNTDCEDIGMTLIAKFEWSGTGYVFEKPAGNEGVVTIIGDTTSGSWTSTQWISAVIIKGGKPPLGSYTYYHDPAVMSGSFSKYNIPLENNPAISNIQFCGGEIMDFGDAPDPTYPTLLASNGARHLITNLYLGSQIDPETDGQPTLNADGDDLANLDDEDGVTFTSALVQGNNGTVNVVASAAGKLDAWIDFNQDGDWNDAGEQIFASQPLAAGVNSLHFQVLINAETGDTYARFRVSTLGGLSPAGLAFDGEVEDYKVTIESGDPCADDIPPTISLLSPSPGTEVYPGQTVIMNYAFADPDGPYPGTIKAFSSSSPWVEFDSHTAAGASGSGSFSYTVPGSVNPGDVLGLKVTFENECANDESSTTAIVGGTTQVPEFTTIGILVAIAIIIGLYFFRRNKTQ